MHAIVPLGVATGPQHIIAILVEFPDKTHTISVSVIRSIFDEMDSYYREVSYGLAWIDATVADKWYQVQTPLSKLNIQKWDFNEKDMDKFRREAVKAADNDVNFRDYDFVYIVGAGEVWGHARCDFGVPTDDGVTTFKGVVVSEQDRVGTYAHELAHLLPSDIEDRGECGLPDLYSYDLAKKDQESSIWIGPWDLMDINNPLRGFSAWSKIALGWLKPETLRLGPAKAFTLNLQPLEKDAGLRAVVVTLTSKASYVIEVRRRIGYDNAMPNEGVLVYFVDMSKESGYGVVRVIDANPNTKTLHDAPFKKGSIFEDAKNGVYVLVALTDGVGFTIVVSGLKVQSLKDTDQDGLLDVIEVQLGTDPKNPDTDGDGLKDSDEVNKYSTDPLKADTDDDGLPDGREIQLRTDPLKADTDDDGLTDGQEVQLSTDPKLAETDGDGLKDGEEVNKYGTDPLKADTDGDDLFDGKEIQVGTNPLKADTDDDELPDGEEVALGTDPLNPDSDSDGLSDGKETQLGTNPLKTDTDRDFWRDDVDPAPTNSLIPNALIIAAIIAVAVAVVLQRRRKRSSVVPADVQATSLTALVGADAANQFCMNCGLAIPLGSTFCPECGAQQ